MINMIVASDTIQFKEPNGFFSRNAIADHVILDSEDRIIQIPNNVKFNIKN